MKKLLTILVLIMLIISFFQIANMYALYKDELQSDYTNLLGVWAIKVNGVDISGVDEPSDGQELTFTMTEENLTYINSKHVKEGKIAPGEQACFEIIIDPTNTDVSILYTLDIELSKVTTAKMKLVRVENYFEKELETGEIDQITNEEVYTGIESQQAVIPIDRINDQYLNHVKLYFEWENVEENNEKDSEIGVTEDAKISVPLKINLKQYTGEVIGDENI